MTIHLQHNDTLGKDPHISPLALLPAEKRLLAALALLVLGALSLIFGMERVVDWRGFGLGIGAALGMILLGLWVRRRKNFPRLALGSIGFGIFASFTGLSALFIYGLFPLPNPMIDHALIRLDARVGYDWATFVEALAKWPHLGRALGWLYGSSLAQVALLIMLLSATHRAAQLHRFLMVGFLALVQAIAIWWLWPSIGPSGYAQPSIEAIQAIGLITSPTTGERLLGLIEHGPAIIESSMVEGMIAFPSYHMIMALMVAWFSWGTRAFPVFVLASIGMVPATLSHGGHHLVDLLAGLAVFATSLWITGRILPHGRA